MEGKKYIIFSWNGCKWIWKFVSEIKLVHNKSAQNLANYVDLESMSRDRPHSSEVQLANSDQTYLQLNFK